MAIGRKEGVTATSLLDPRDSYNPVWIEQLESSADIASIRTVLNDHHVAAFPATISGVHQALTVALRVVVLICDSIDESDNGSSDWGFP